MRHLSELNLNEGGQPITRKAPTEMQINEFQFYFGVVLPEEYVFFLRYSNGGHPELNSFALGSSEKCTLFGIDYFYFLNDDKDNISSIWSSSIEWRTTLGMNIIAIGGDDGGNQLMLSFDQSPPSVKLCIHDENMLVLLPLAFLTSVRTLVPLGS